jgi:tripartite-type tricarboxylate transporter receptor subunit TctC
MRRATTTAALAPLLFAITFHCPPAVAEDTYPSRTVRILLSMPSGSAPDIRTRIIGHALTTAWGRQVVSENRPGAGGALAVQAALAAPADGYTLLSTVASVFTVLPAQRDKLPFDVNRDLVPIALLSNEGMVLAVPPKLGVNDMAGLIALAKTKPDQLVIGTNPAGSLPHLAARLFVKLAKAPMTVSPSTGGTTEAVREILGGRAHAVVESRPGLKAQLDVGDLKALAIMTDEPVSSFPDLPTAALTVPGLRAVGWTGIFAPRDVPEPIVKRLVASLREALETPEVKTRFAQTGSPFRLLFTSDLARFIEAEQKLWWPVVKEAGLQ